MLGKYLINASLILTQFFTSPFSSPQEKLNIQEMIQANLVVTDKKELSKKQNMAFEINPDGKT